MKGIFKYLFILVLGLWLGYYLKGKLEPCPPQTVIETKKIKQKGKNNKQETEIKVEDVEQ